MICRICVLGVSLAAAAALMLPGCAAKDEGPKTPRVALVMKSLANEFFKTMEDGAVAYQKDHVHTFELITNGIPNETDVAGQVKLVEQMMAQDVDAIVIAPADSRALVSVLARAMNQGIEVVNIDNKLDAAALAERGLSIPFVGPNNRKGARMAAARLAAALEAGDPVGLIGGIPSAYNAIERQAGFEEGMQSAGMEIVSKQSAQWEMAKANQVASAMLGEHPEIRALLCANDSMALGAVAALRDAGKLGAVKVIGFDNIAAVQELVESGEVLCTVDQHADKLAVFGIQYAVSMLMADAAPEDWETPVDLVTAETLAAAAGS